MRKLSLFLVLALLLSLAPAAPAEDTFTVYLPQFTVGEAQEEACAYASRLLWSAGMNITLKVYTASQNSREAYLQFIRDHIGQENAAFVYTAEALTILQEEGWFDEILPLSQSTQPINRMAVLVKSDLLQAYGMPIRTARALEDFLSWRHQETGAVPCAASPFLYDRMYGGFQWLNLFLPEEGYYAINHEFSAFSAAADLFATLEGDALYSMQDLPVLENCAQRYLDWIRGGLITPYLPKPQTKLEGYDAQIINTEDFLAPLMLQNNAPLSKLDFSGYSLQILYAQELPQVTAETVPASAYGICAGEGAMEQVNAFLGWLEDRENYRLLRYGLEDTDYQWQDDTLVLLPGSHYSLWEQRVVFEQTALEPVVYQENLPQNFREEMQLILSAPEAVFTPEWLDEAEVWLLDENHILPVYQLASSAHTFWEKIYQYPTMASESAFTQWLDTIQKPQDAIEDILEELNGLLQ